MELGSACVPRAVFGVSLNTWAAPNAMTQLVYLRASAGTRRRDGGGGGLRNNRPARAHLGLSQTAGNQRVCNIFANHTVAATNEEWLIDTTVSSIDLMPVNHQMHRWPGSHFLAFAVVAAGRSRRLWLESVVHLNPTTPNGNSENRGRLLVRRTGDLLGIALAIAAPDFSVA